MFRRRCRLVVPHTSPRRGGFKPGITPFTKYVGSCFCDLLYVTHVDRECALLGAEGGYHNQFLKAFPRFGADCGAGPKRFWCESACRCHTLNTRMLHGLDARFAHRLRISWRLSVRRLRPVFATDGTQCRTFGTHSVRIYGVHFVSGFAHRMPIWYSFRAHLVHARCVFCGDELRPVFAPFCVRFVQNVSHFVRAPCVPFVNRFTHRMRILYVYRTQSGRARCVCGVYRFDLDLRKRCGFGVHAVRIPSRYHRHDLRTECGFGVRSVRRPEIIFPTQIV